MRWGGTPSLKRRADDAKAAEPLFKGAINYLAKSMRWLHCDRAPRAFEDRPPPSQM